MMIEYVLLGGVNDTEADAQRLVQLLQGSFCFVNLIVFNPYPGTIFRQSDQGALDRFITICYE